MRLYLNVDHVATVRQARRATEPDPVQAARACLRGGADGITVHLREDRRHIQDGDVRRLAAENMVLNLELATAPDIIELAAELRPHQVTFVPERREEVTTEGGLDLSSHDGEPDPRLREAMKRLQGVGIRTSLFIDPNSASVATALALGADAIELHTGSYANSPADRPNEIARLKAASVQTHELGISVHAGHGLTLDNVSAVAELPHMEELNIGHSIVSRSIFTGIEHAVREMREAIDGSVR